jgi:hypothetical protein
MEFKFKTGNVALLSDGTVGLLVNLPGGYKKDLNELSKLIESDKEKTLEVKLYRQKRSNDSNSYCWVLIDKIAKKLNSTDEEIYTNMLRRYGSKDYIAAPKSSEEILRRAYKIVEPIKDCMINNTPAVTFRLIRGSSTYDSLEMSVLINGIVEEAKQLGIETMTPNEIYELMQKWGSND